MDQESIEQNSIPSCNDAVYLGFLSYIISIYTYFPTGLNYCGKGNQVTPYFDDHFLIYFDQKSPLIQCYEEEPLQEDLMIYCMKLCKWMI
jgi:hypothetical protein